MKTKIFMLFLAFFCFSGTVISVVHTEENYVLAGKNDTVKTTTDRCNFLLGDVNDKDSFAHFLQDIFNVMKYGGPLLCIVLSMFDFLKAITSQDKDMLIKATKRTGKRIVFALALFFIPTLINFIFPLLGWYGTCNIG